MAYIVSNDYKNIIYSGDARNKLKLSFNNVELENPDLYCEKLTIKSRIISNGSKSFSLNNFISKEAELILHNVDLSLIQDQVSISIGTLVGNSYEYVPIGIFNIQNQPTTDKDRTTIQLRDNSVKFDFNYNAQPLIEENGGSATKLQILQDICTQAGVTCNITSFIGYLDEIGVYDNSITARQYIANIAEQAGKIATINRSGELIFIDLNDLTTWEIPIEIVEKYESGTTYKIGKVVYEDGIIRYETEDSNDDTLFINGSDNYINGELTKEQAISSDNSYYLQNTGDSELAKLEIEGKTMQATRSGKNILKLESGVASEGMTTVINADGSITYSGTVGNTYFQNTSYVNTNLVAGTYTFSRYENLAYNTLINVVYSDNSNENKVIWANQTSVTFTTTKVISKYRIMTSGLTTNTQYNETLFLQLESGSSSTTYEQFGVMPSPDNPSDLISVGYQNLLKLGTGTTSRNNTELSVNNNVINFKNTGTTNYVAYGIDNELRNANYGNYVGWKNMTLKAGAYTLNYEYISGSTTTSTASNNSLRLIVYGRSAGDTGRVETNLATVYMSLVSSYVKFTIAQDMEINVVVYLYASSATVDINFSTWLTNTSEESEYIPYGKYGIEVKTTGKNLFDSELGTTSIGGVTLTYNNDKTITINGTATSNATAYAFSKYPSGTTFIKLQPNKKYSASVTKISGTLTLGTNTEHSSVQFWQPWDYGFQLFFNNILNNKVYATKTPTSEINLERIQIAIRQGDIFDNFKIGIQFEEGDLTNYEEYKEDKKVYTLDEPLRGIGDYKDKLYIKNGYLYAERKIGNITLNGTETGWNYQNSCFTISVNGIKETPAYADIDQKLVMSDYFAWQLSCYRGSLQDLHITKAIDGGNPKQIAFKYSTYTSTNDFKTWLSTHNTEVNYVLATPIVEELGTVELPLTYDNVTIIDLYSRINTNSYIQYRQSTTQLQAILNEVNEFDINSLKTGKILGNPAIDPYDLIQIVDGENTYTTLATNDLVYNGVLINTFDTQIEEEEKQQNVSILGEATFKKWAQTSIDNIEGSITLQAGQIDETNGRINETNLVIEKDGALLSVLANNSNIDIEYDGDTPISGEVREVTTTTGFKFNADGMTISDDSSNFYALHRNTGTYYYDGGIDPTKIVGQYTKDGSKQKDLVLFGVYYYGMEEITDTPMFVTELYNDENGEECVGHFYNRGD